MTRFAIFFDLDCINSCASELRSTPLSTNPLVWLGLEPEPLSMECCAPPRDNLRNCFSERGSAIICSGIASRIFGESLAKAIRAGSNCRVMSLG